MALSEGINWRSSCSAPCRNRRTRLSRCSLRQGSSFTKDRASSAAAATAGEAAPDQTPAGVAWLAWQRAYQSTFDESTAANSEAIGHSGRDTLLSLLGNGGSIDSSWNEPELALANDRSADDSSEAGLDEGGSAPLDEVFGQWGNGAPNDGFGMA